MAGNLRGRATDQKSFLLLHRGEREVILLAEQKRANLLLIDEKRGSAEAERRSISSTGTLGVLLEAGRRGLLNPETALQQLLSETTFRATVSVREQFWNPAMGSKVSSPRFRQRTLGRRQKVERR